MKKFKGKKFRLGGKMPQSAKDAIGSFWRGKKHSEEWKANISAGNKGKKRTLEQIEKMRLARTGKSQPPEVTEKIRAKNKGRKYPIVNCPHCEVSGGKSAMLRHHFKHCKNKVTL